MRGSIRFSDYRCFRREAPAVLPLEPGFTAFLGPNNVGKSALIRSLYDLRSLFAHVLTLPQNPQAFVAQRFGINVAPPTYEVAELINDRDDPDCRIELAVDQEANAKLPYIQKVGFRFVVADGRFRARLHSSDGAEIGIPDTDLAIAGMPDPRTISTRSGHQYDFGPLLTLLEQINTAQFYGPFRNAINEGAGTHYDAQIGTGFIAQWHNWKTGPSRAHNVAIQRVTEDIRRLIGARTLEISASAELKTLQVIVDGRPHKLQALGSGIAQLIVVLGNALTRRPSYIVIDEPETHLHPSLQMEFLTTLATHATSGIIFATHSLGLARSIADRVLTVQRRNDDTLVRPFERTPRYAEFLGSLGLSALQDLGWDKILLVEGPKDVRTFQSLLRLYDKDRQTIVLPLGGSSMINGGMDHELSEVVRMGGKVAAIVDSERKSKDEPLAKDRREFAALCAKLNIDCCVIELRAIENYLPTRVLKLAFGDDVVALGPYEATSESTRFWGKGESWRAAKLMTAAEVSATDIGQILNRL